MRDPIHRISASPSSPKPYPVSTRTYKKRDYDYLSNFPRMMHSVMSRKDAVLLQERSEFESDLSMTGSSAGYTTFNSSSTCSTSSAQSYAKHLIAAMDTEGHDHQDHHHQQQHQPPFLTAETCAHSPNISVDCTESAVKETCAHSPHISVDCTESAVEELKNDKIDDSMSADVKEDDKMNITGDSPGPIERAPAQVNEPGISQSKPKPRSHNAPAVLPKFGSWDTRNPSSGEAYTLIFRRLRDEKQAGGLPVCTSPTHSKEEGPEKPLSQENKPKEPLHPKPRMRKDSSRQSAKGKSHQEAAHSRKNVMRWNLCCKASVLDD